LARVICRDGLIVDDVLAARYVKTYGSGRSIMTARRCNTDNLENAGGRKSAADTVTRPRKKIYMFSVVHNRHPMGDLQE